MSARKRRGFAFSEVLMGLGAMSASLGTLAVTMWESPATNGATVSIATDAVTAIELVSFEEAEDPVSSESAYDGSMVCCRTPVGNCFVGFGNCPVMSTPVRCPCVQPN